MINIALSESDAAITKKIYAALAKELNLYLIQKTPKVMERVKSDIEAALYGCPEIQSLKNGRLKADFGLTSDPTGPIVSSILSTLNIKTEKVSAATKTFKGGFTLTMQPNDYSNILSLSASKQIIQGGSIPWLKWLLTLGDSIIIANFGVEYGPFGRSGMARMTEKQRPFKVNSAFSGTNSDNFITRALSTNKTTIEKSIVKVLT